MDEEVKKYVYLKRFWFIIMKSIKQWKKEKKIQFLRDSHQYKERRVLWNLFHLNDKIDECN